MRDMPCHVTVLLGEVAVPGIIMIRGGRCFLRLCPSRVYIARIGSCCIAVGKWGFIHAFELNAQLHCPALVKL